jgi:hypothetical protein
VSKNSGSVFHFASNSLLEAISARFNELTIISSLGGSWRFDLKSSARDVVLAVNCLRSGITPPLMNAAANARDGSEKGSQTSGSFQFWDPDVASTLLTTESESALLSGSSTCVVASNNFDPFYAIQIGDIFVANHSFGLLDTVSSTSR